MRPAFRKAALEDGRAAAESMGIDMSVAPELVILENTPEVHHVVACTLCSRYPRAVLGLPPAWYKSAAYRSRTVADPRGVLREFGLELPEEVEIRVADSTAICATWSFRSSPRAARACRRSNCSRWWRGTA